MIVIDGACLSKKDFIELRKYFIKITEGKDILTVLCIYVIKNYLKLSQINHI
jgi:hypothetical protein